MIHSLSNGIYTHLPRPLQTGWNWLFPGANPTVSLNKTQEIASKVLRNLDDKGIKMPTEDEKAYRSIIQGRLQKDHSKEDKEPDLEVSSIANDPEVTRAPDLEVQAQAIDWTDKAKEKEQVLIEKLSAFAALIQMRNWCGIVEKDSLSLMELAKEATTGKNPPSVWSLFNKHYGKRLSLFQKVQAAFYYVIYYQTSLINNIVKAYTHLFIMQIKNHLSEKDGARTNLFRKILKNANEFLDGDNRAKKKFAKEKEEGTLTQCCNRAIEKQYGFDLMALCKKFSEHLVEKHLVEKNFNGDEKGAYSIKPTVKLFEAWQGIPLLGWFFQAFETFVNRFIIRRTMKNHILPGMLSSLVEEGTKSASSLPFVISLTRFFRTQMEALLSKVEKEGLQAESVKRAPGTEDLTPTVKNLLRALALEPEVKQKTDSYAPTSEQDRSELLPKIKKDEDKSKNPQPLDPLDIDTQIERGIEEGIINGGNLLFNYLNKAAASDELFVHALDLAQAPFDGKNKTTKDLEDEYATEYSKLETAGSRLFGIVVEDAVSKMLFQKTNVRSPEIAKDALSMQKTIAKVSLEQAEARFQSMQEIFKQKENLTSESTNLQSDISSFAYIMQAFSSSNQDIMDSYDKMDSVEVRTVKGAISPITKAFEESAEYVSELSKTQNDYSSHMIVSRTLKEIATSLKEIQSKPQKTIKDLQRAVQSIPKLLGKPAPVSKRLKKDFDLLEKLVQKRLGHQQVLMALCTLYPPREAGTNPQQKGLLDQLLEVEQGRVFPGFKRATCMKQIREQLENLPEIQRKQIAKILDESPSLLKSMGQLKGVMQPLFDAHTQALKKSTRDCLAIAEPLAIWAEDKKGHYEKEADHIDYPKMEQNLEGLRASLEKVKEGIAQEDKSFAKDISSPFATKLTRMLPALATFSLGGVAGSALGGGLGYLFGSAYTGTAAVGGAAAVGSPAGIYGAVKSDPERIKKQTFAKVWKTFQKAYQFIHKERIYKAALTRVMKEGSSGEL